MPSFSKLAVASAALIGVANAACPNACSGRGTCGAHDECACFNNWSGNDCSLRQCPSFKAWVVTPEGDINQDGDLTDATIHSTTIRAQNHPTFFNDVTGGTGRFESWPMNKIGSQATVDEGHYYMECANQGLCDRKTGQCDCFTGYEGVACRRSACPNDCSGNGVCRTVGEIGSGLSEHLSVTYSAGSTAADISKNAGSIAISNGALNYNFWDSDMSQSCVCDAGFIGADCSERSCPLGDDPLTTGQHVETQYVDVYAEKQFAGSVQFTYTDLFGESWTTAPVDTAHYEGAAGDLASDAEAALRALPDQMLAEVSVTVNYCEKVLAGYHDVAIASEVATVSAATTNSGHGTHSSSTATIDVPESMLIRRKGDNAVHSLSDTSVGSAIYGYSAGADATHADQVVYEVAKNFCTRYEITFTGRSGDIPDLAVDTSGVTVPSGIDECDNTGSTDGSIAQSGTEVTVTVGTQAATASTPNAAFTLGNPFVHVDCDGVSYGIVKLTAISATEVKYQATAASVAACTSKVVKIQRVIAHGSLSTLNGVGSSVTDTLEFSASTTVTQIAGSAATHTCTSNGEIASKVFTCTGGTDYNDNFHYDELVSVTCGTTPYGQYTVASSTADTITFKEAIPDCAASSTVTVTAVDWIVKTDVAVVEINADGHTLVGKSISVSDGTDTNYCDVIAVVADASDSLTSGTRLRCGNNAGAGWKAITGSTTLSKLEGSGTTEAEICADRGVCDTSVGLCECFKGYYGNDCSTQNSLSA